MNETRKEIMDIESRIIAITGNDLNRLNQCHDLLFES